MEKKLYYLSPTMTFIKMEEYELLASSFSYEFFTN